MAKSGSKENTPEAAAQTYDNVVPQDATLGVPFKFTTRGREFSVKCLQDASPGNTFNVTLPKSTTVSLFTLKSLGKEKPKQEREAEKQHQTL